MLSSFSSTHNESSVPTAELSSFYAPLGNYAKVSSRVDAKPFLAPDLRLSAADARRLQYRSAAVVRSLLPRETFPNRHACHRYLIPVESHTELVLNSESKRAHFSNLVTCNSPRCPHCAPKLAQRRALQLAHLVDLVQAAGHVVVHVSSTLRHVRSDRCADLYSQLTHARKRMRSGSAWNKFRKYSGLLGTALSVEVTHGDNGFHPHTHELFVFDVAAAERAFLQKRDEIHRDLAKLQAADATDRKYRQAGRIRRRAARRARLIADLRAYEAIFSELRAAALAQREEREAVNLREQLIEAAHGRADLERAKHLIERQRRARRDGVRLLELERRLTDLWLSALAKSGGSAERGPALRASTASASIADYLNKFGKLASGPSIARELTGIATKRGRAGGLSMPTILAIAAGAGDADPDQRQHAKAIYKEYELASRGRASFNISPGISQFWQLAKERAEEFQTRENAQREAANVTLAIIPRHEWRMLRRDKRHLLPLAPGGAALSEEQPPGTGPPMLERARPLPRPPDLAPGYRDLPAILELAERDQLQELADELRKIGVGLLTVPPKPDTEHEAIYIPF